ncbi:MAG: FHA domain-containing protein [Chloroflexota bacterium]
MEEYIEVKIDVFEHTDQRAMLRKNLTVTALIDEILKEFDDIIADSPSKYAVYLKGNDRALNRTQTLEQLDIQPHDELVFNYGRQSNIQMLEPGSYPSLFDASQNRYYEIQWQPAIIGRPTNDPDHNIMLAVNLQQHPKGNMVSRKHARITFNQGSYFIEPLAENNPVFVNGKQISLNTRKEIKNGDRIIIGKSDLVLTFSSIASRISTPPQPVKAAPPLQTPAASAPVIQLVQTPAPVQPAAEAVSSEQTGGEKGFTSPEPAPAAAAVSPAMDMTAVQPSKPLPEVQREPTSRSARLVITRAMVQEKIGKSFEIQSFPYLVGREVPIFAGEGEISRRHAELNYDPASDAFSVIDLQSTNGVSLDGSKLEPNRRYKLHSGSNLGFGSNFLCVINF